MSVQNAKDFLSKLSSDSKFREAMRTCTDRAQAVKLIADADIGSFSEGDLHAVGEDMDQVVASALARAKELAGEELTDEELENVAGGKSDDSCSGKDCNTYSCADHGGCTNVNCDMKT